jgi:hypothetical protein
MKNTGPLEAFLWGCALGLVLVALIVLLVGCPAQPDMDTSTAHGKLRAIALDNGYRPGLTGAHTATATATVVESAQRAWERRVRDAIPCEDGRADMRWPSKVVEYHCPEISIHTDGQRTRDRWSHVSVYTKEIP